MRLFATALIGAVLAAGSGALADDEVRRDEPKAEAPAPQTPSETRADIYARLAASKDSDETEGLVGLLLVAYQRSGSDTVDLLLERAHKAIVSQDADAAERILDAAVAFMPGEAEAWNARATLRYLDDDYDASMADIAETPAVLCAIQIVLCGSCLWEAFLLPAGLRLPGSAQPPACTPHPTSPCSAPPARPTPLHPTHPPPPPRAGCAGIPRDAGAVPCFLHTPGGGGGAGGTDGGGL